MDTLDRRDASRLPILLRWMDFAAWLLPTTARFPKHWRHTLVQRLDSEALEIQVLLTEAAYRRKKLDVLRQANRHLSRLRALLEIAVRIGAMPRGAHEQALLVTDEVGRMLGGWMKQAAEREGFGPRSRSRRPS